LEIKNFIKNIKTQTLVPNAFDEESWTAAIESVVIRASGEMEFNFWSGI
jgi:hypothetical protein